MSLSASAAKKTLLLWRTPTCSFRDPAFEARRKSLLAGINYSPGLLRLPDYLQLLHTRASAWCRGADTAPLPLLPARRSKEQLQTPLGVAGTLAKREQRWCPWRCFLQAIWAANRAQLMKKIGRTRTKSKHCCQQRPSFSYHAGFAFRLQQNISRRPFFVNIQVWGTGTGQGEGAQVTEPVQLLPRLWASAGKSSLLS